MLKEEIFVTKCIELKEYTSENISMQVHVLYDLQIGATKLGHPPSKHLIIGWMVIDIMLCAVMLFLYHLCRGAQYDVQQAVQYEGDWRRGI